MAQARSNTKTTTEPEQVDAVQDIRTELDKTDSEPAGQDHTLVEDATTGPLSSTTEDVVLIREAGGHKAGDTITVTRGAADYLREQGYAEGDD